MTRYVVIGCGGVGGLYGSRLAEAGHDVTFLVRSEVDVLRRQGLRLDSVYGDLRLEPGSFAATSDATSIGETDVVIVALKTTANAVLHDLLPPLVGTSTTVAAFQNGLGIEDEIATIVSSAGSIVAGMCFVCSVRVAPGHIDHIDYGAVTLAVHTGTAEPLATDLAGAGIPTTVADDLITGRWSKLLWNIPFNGLTALLGVGTDELLADGAGRLLARELMDETLEGARACGASLQESDADQLMAYTETMVPYKSSMALDREAGRPLEVDAIYAAPVAAARAAGVEVPRIAQLRDLLAMVSA